MGQTIQETLDDHLCNNCGTCVGICPQQAISINLDEYSQIYEIKISADACSECGICYDICPGHQVDFKGINKEIFGKEAEDIILGSYLKCYTGYAKESNVRYNASSGGAITGLLVYALEHGVIDGALVTRMKKDRPWEPEPFIARNKDEIIAASKSKYCPVPANIMLRELMNAPDGEKFAVVGLPCHIHGIRKSEQAYQKLRTQIVLHVGLFCSHTDTFWQTDQILRMINVSKEELKSIRYRGDGWPGKFSVELKDGENSSISFRDAMFPHILWCNAMNRCLYCCDLTAELADVSVGDPWIPEVMSKEEVGQSMIIARTEDANSLILRAAQDEYLHIDPTPVERVIVSVSRGETKKADVQVRMSFRKAMGKNIPKYNVKLLAPRPHNYVRGLVPLISSVASSNIHFQMLCKVMIKYGLQFSKKMWGE